MSTTVWIIVATGAVLICAVGYGLYRRNANRDRVGEIYPLF